MPTFEIGLSDGRVLHVDAPDQAAAEKGVQNFIGGNDKPAGPSGIMDSLRQGGSNALTGIGTTLHDYLGAGPVGNAATAAGQAIAPPSFTPSPLVDKEGVHPSNLPAWLAVRAPGVLAQLAAAKVGGIATRGSMTGKLAGAGIAGVGMTAGPEAEEAQANQPGNVPGTPPNADALLRGGLTSGAENAIGVAPFAGFLGKGTGAITPGLKGALAGAERFATNAGLQGAGSGAADVAHQVGQSVGTPGGVNVNPLETADATLGGAAMGGVLNAPGLTRDTLNARRFSAANTPELQTGMTQVANRATDAAGGREVTPEVGADIAHKVDSGVRRELSDAVKGLEVDLTPDAKNIISSTEAGRMPTGRDYSTLKTALGDDPQASSVLSLINQAHALSIVKGTGNLGDNTFTGGMNAALNKLNPVSPHNILKTGLVAGAGALGIGLGHLIAYSPAMIGAALGAKALAKLGDRVTGSNNPMQRFMQGFGDNGATPVRVAAPEDQAAAPSSQDLVNNLLGREGPTPTQPDLSPLHALAAKVVQPSAPAKVTIKGGNLNVTNGAGEADPFPASRYAHLTAAEAGHAIAQSYANPKVSKAAVAKGATLNVTNIRAANAQLVNRSGLPTAAVAKFEGRHTQKDATAYRDVLKAAYPHAAAALDHVYSDQAIKGIWTTPGK
jgi:hypothetical protein